MTLFHDDSSHIGWKKGLEKLKETLFWPRISQSFRKYVNNCKSCILGKSNTGKRAGLCQLGDKPEEAFDTWHIDHAGSLVNSQRFTQILVLIDSFSKYCRFVPIARKTTANSINALKRIFLEIGKPKKIIADRATAFSAKVFLDFLNENAFCLHLIATGVPRGNGQVERVMRTLFNLMRSTLNAEKETKWTDVIKSIETDINETISASTKTTPTFLMFGQSNHLPSTTEFLQGVSVSVSKTQEEVLQQARDLLKKSQLESIERLNTKRKQAAPFLVGDLVAVEDTQAPSRGKLGLRFKGPFKVINLLLNDRYVLSRGGKRTTVAARDQLRKWPVAL